VKKQRKVEVRYDLPTVKRLASTIKINFQRKRILSSRACYLGIRRLGTDDFIL